MSSNHQHKQYLSLLFQTALNAVNGRMVVENKLKKLKFDGKVAVVAIGKAAATMMAGAKLALKEKIDSALIITKTGHADTSLSWPYIEAGHPVPNTQSLEAGVKLLDFLTSVPAGVEIIALISGGASSLVEVLPDHINLEELQKINNWLLSSGLTIHEINRVRQAISLIKGGKALAYLKHKKMTQLLISDVKFDRPEIIGSGIFVSNTDVGNLQNAVKLPVWLENYIQEEIPRVALDVDSHVIASNDMACQAIIKQAKESSYDVTYHGQTLYGDVFDVAESLHKTLFDAEPGIHIWGGETTLKLPENPGRGGRNQSLALALACLVENQPGITILVGATDGSDGPTDDAGAIIDGYTLHRASYFQAKKYLANADAGTFLAEAGDLLSTGPTGTNVMDIVIAIKEPI